MRSPISPPPDWGEFPNTILEFATTPPVIIDLRAPLGDVQRKQFQTAGLERPFCIVTAQDPRGVTLPPDQNQQLASHLQHQLESAGIYYVPVVARSPDHAHSEASVAVDLPCDEAIALAKRFDQLAIFWFDGDRFWILPALATTPAVSLPLIR